MQEATKGERWSTTTGAPPLAGVVERIGTGKNLHEALLRLDEPAPGAALVEAFTWGDKVHEDGGGRGGAVGSCVAGVGRGAVSGDC